MDLQYGRSEVGTTLWGNEYLQYSLCLAGLISIIHTTSQNSLTLLVVTGQFKGGVRRSNPDILAALDLVPKRKKEKTSASASSHSKAYLFLSKY